MLLNQLFEAISRTGKGNTAVVGWGRGMGHKGHMMLASSVITKAKDVGGDPYFVVSRTVGKDDPITPEEKLAIYKKVFPQQGHIFQAASDEIPDLTRVLSNLNQQGYSNAVVVVGADQVKAFQYLKQYNGKPDKAGNVAFNFDSLDVISRQETSDPSAGEEGPRATPMRQVLLDPSKSEEEQFAVWRDAMSPEISDDEVRDLMNKAKERMAQFSTPKSKKSSSIKESLQDKIKALATLNNIADVNKIIAGQVLKLPDGGTYKIQYGDTLSQIAAKLNFPTNPSRPGTAPSLGAPSAIQGPPASVQSQKSGDVGRSAGRGGASPQEIDDYKRRTGVTGPGGAAFGIYPSPGRRTTPAAAPSPQDSNTRIIPAVPAQGQRAAAQPAPQDPNPNARIIPANPAQGSRAAPEVDITPSQSNTGVRTGPNPNIDQTTRDQALASVKPSATGTQAQQGPAGQSQSSTQSQNTPPGTRTDSNPTDARLATGKQTAPADAKSDNTQPEIPANVVRTGSGGILTTSDGTPVTSGSLPDFKAIEAAKEKLTPSQLRWLGDADPTDPAVKARMPKPEPGEKPVGDTKPSTSNPRDNTNPTDARLATGKQTAPADKKSDAQTDKRSTDLDKILKFTANTGSRQHFDRLEDKFQEKVEAAAAEYFAKTGKKLQINSAFRDEADQQRLWDISVANGTPGRMPNGFPVAKPKPGGGGSDHERGVAVDIQQGINDPVAIEILKKYGLFQTVASDPVHFTEPRGARPATAANTAPSNAVTSSDGQPVRTGTGGYVTSGEPRPGTDKPIQSVRSSGPGFIEITTPDGEVQRREGTANWRMNNPGNIRVSDWTRRQPGFVGVGDAGSSGKFAVFATLADGTRAKKNLLFGPGSSYINLSIKKAIERYAPESDGNKTSSYIDRVVQATKATPDTLLSQLSASQREAMFDVINRVEGFKVGKIQTVQSAMGEGRRKEKQVAVSEDLQAKISNLISILETKHRKINTRSRI